MTERPIDLRAGNESAPGEFYVFMHHGQVLARVESGHLSDAELDALLAEFRGPGCAVVVEVAS